MDPIEGDINLKTILFLNEGSSSAHYNADLALNVNEECSIIQGKLRAFDDPNFSLDLVRKTAIPPRANFRLGVAQPCASDFSIVNMLGKGSFGTVLLTKERLTNIHLAMKIVSKGLLAVKN